MSRINITFVFILSQRAEFLVRDFRLISSGNMSLRISFPVLAITLLLVGTSADDLIEGMVSITFR